MEKITNRAHLVNINDMEQKLIVLAQDPSDESGIESLVKDKENENQVLKGKLKISSTKCIQTQELVEQRKKRSS